MAKKQTITFAANPLAFVRRPELPEIATEDEIVIPKNWVLVAYNEKNRVIGEPQEGTIHFDEATFPGIKTKKKGLFSPRHIVELPPHVLLVRKEKFLASENVALRFAQTPYGLPISVDGMRIEFNFTANLADTEKPISYFKLFDHIRTFVKEKEKLAGDAIWSMAQLSQSLREYVKREFKTSRLTKIKEAIEALPKDQRKRLQYWTPGNNLTPDILDPIRDDILQSVHNMLGLDITLEFKDQVN